MTKRPSLYNQLARLRRDLARCLRAMTRGRPGFPQDAPAWDRARQTAEITLEFTRPVRMDQAGDFSQLRTLALWHQENARRETDRLELVLAAIRSRCGEEAYQSVCQQLDLTPESTREPQTPTSP